MEATCTECNKPVELEDGTEIGDVIICSSCGAELEVLSVNPPEVETLEEGK